MKEQKPLNLKIVVVGERKVGKTSIIDRYVDNEFNEKYSQTKYSYIAKKRVSTGKYKSDILFIFDISEKGEYRNFANYYYRDAPAIILVYDKTNKKSFEEIKNFWIKDVKKMLLKISVINN